VRRIVPLALLPLSLAACGARTAASHGVRLAAPHGWQRLAPAGDGNVVDPRTLLVVGTGGVAPRASRCQLASYRVQPREAVVVVVGWKPGGTPANRPGRAPLRALRSLRRGTLECFAGRAAAAQVTLGGRVYQVNVLVGDRAPERLVRQALSVARSFDRVH
jgi:hypothetical protein